LTKTKLDALCQTSSGCGDRNGLGNLPGKDQGSITDSPSTPEVKGVSGATELMFSQEIDSVQYVQSPSNAAAKHDAGGPDVLQVVR
jgi:hypothetical protein